MCLHDYNSFILCSPGLKLAMKVTDTYVNATMQKNGIRRVIQIFAYFAIFSIRIFCVLTPFHIPQHNYTNIYPMRLVTALQDFVASLLDDGSNYNS